MSHPWLEQQSILASHILEQHRILYPKPFALSLDLENSEPKLEGKFEEWELLGESSFRIC